ncbi:hypothetical protein ACPVPU_14640 [Sphingomonas sp. CJ99]
MTDEPTRKNGNEITDVALSAKATREAIEEANAGDPAKSADEVRRWPTSTIGIAAGIGVGSAALVAALLYANRGKGKK